MRGSGRDLWTPKGRFPRISTGLLSDGPPPYPQDGDIWIATTVDANGARQQFQYNAGSSSTSKWEFIGGSPQRFSGASVVNLTGAGTWVTVKTLTAARAGDYNVRGGYRFTVGATAAHHVYAGIGANAAGATNYTGDCTVPATVSGFAFTNPVEDTVTLTAGQTANLSGQSGSISGGTDATVDCFLFMTPIRIA